MELAGVNTDEEHVHVWLLKVASLWSGQLYRLPKCRFACMSIAMELTAIKTDNEHVCVQVARPCDGNGCKTDREHVNVCLLQVTCQCGLGTGKR